MSLLLWWAALVALGEAALPISARLVAGAPDRGLALSRPLGLLVVAWTVWTLGALGASVRFGLIAAVVVLVVAFASGRLARTAVRLPDRRERVAFEIAFAAAFLFFVWVRSLRPEIFGTEKLMDFALFNACWRTEGLPPEDPWLGGTPVHYYYFGYLLFALPARALAIAPEVAYGLALATIGAMLFTGAASFGRSQTGRWSLGIVGGLAAAVAGNLDGAQQILIEGRRLGDLDYFRSSRIVPNTINEFPFFSLLHGDLHPHVTALVLLIPFLTVVTAWSSRRARGERAVDAALVAGLLVGSLAVTNPWDVPFAVGVAGLLGLHLLARPGTRIGSWLVSARPDDRKQPSFAVASALESSRENAHPSPSAVAQPHGRNRPSFAVASVLESWRERVKSSPSLLGCAAAALAALLLPLPFLAHFRSPYGGVGLVSAHTSLGEAFLVFAPLFLPVAAALASCAPSLLPAAKDRRDLLAAAAAAAGAAVWIASGSALLFPLLVTAALALAVLLRTPEGGRDAPALVLTVVSLGAIGACEVVFLRDPYGGEMHRMNTVFKLYYEAWIGLALALPSAILTLEERLGRPRLVHGATALLGGLTLVYPIAATTTFSDGAPFSLGGLAWLDRDHPDDARAIRWLRDLPVARPIVLEATGDPYSYFARVSSVSGLPTLLGWANHEGVWRGPDPRIEERRRIVKDLYDSTDAERVGASIAALGVRYIFVGELERANHAAPGLAKFENDPARYREVFRSGRSAVFEVMAGSPPEARRPRVVIPAKAEMHVLVASPEPGCRLLPA